MPLEDVIADLTAAYAAVPEVLAIVQGGSRTIGRQDADSDLDLYVYSQDGVPLPARRAVIESRAARFELDNRVAEIADIWTEREGSLPVEVIFRRTADFEAHFEYLFGHDEAKLGYSTSVWFNVRSSRILFDRSGWFARLQQLADRPYPEALARSIIALNVPLLKSGIFSRAKQIEVAVRRDDLVAVQLELTKLLESYFDVLFALNRTLYPGAKRQLLAMSFLSDVPPGAAAAIENLLSYSVSTLNEVPQRVEALVQPLLSLLATRGELPATES